jgi:hypothetical protein
MRKINRTKLLARKHDSRSTKLFVIATEGEKTEKQYFGLFENRQIKLEVLATGTDGHSAPQHVIERLNIFKEKYDVGSDDMLWLVIDVDSWHRLSSVCGEAKEKGYYLAVSNRCFEVWLCLHFENLNPEDKTCDHFKKRLRTILGSYNGSNLDLSCYKPNIQNAINRARDLDTNPNENFPSTLGSHVYKLVESILQSLND